MRTLSTETTATHYRTRDHLFVMSVDNGANWSQHGIYRAGQYKDVLEHALRIVRDTPGAKVSPLLPYGAGWRVTTPDGRIRWEWIAL